MLLFAYDDNYHIRLNEQSMMFMIIMMKGHEERIRSLKKIVNAYIKRIFTISSIQQKNKKNIQGYIWI